jgi:ADP-heptose:LPS heptosyltransferase
MSDHHADVLKALAPDAPARLGVHRPRLSPNPLASLPKDYVLLHTGAGSPDREWVVEEWVELARRLSARHPIVVAGVGERERRCAEAIASAVPSAVNLVDSLSWDEFCGLVRDARVLISLDSAPSHLAASLDVPVVAITSGRNPPGLWAPRTDRAAVVTFPTACAPCFRPRGCQTMACVQNIVVADVLTAVRTLGIEP